MPERKLIERLADAVTQLRDPLPTKMLGDIETKSSEARPEFAQGYSPSFSPAWSWGQRSTIDYRGELGDLSGSSLVMAVVNWTGINLAEALPVVFKPDAKGVPQIDPGNVAADLIRRPNPFHIWADYTLCGAFSWWMGDWYMQKVRDQAGALIELWYLPHHLVEPRWPFDGKSPEVPLSEVEGDPREAFISHYQYTRPGKSPVLIKKSDMVHIKRGVNPNNPRKGIGVWDGVLEELYGHNAVNRFSAAILGNMGMYSVLLSPKDPSSVVSPEQAAMIKEQYIINTTGANAGKPLVNPVAIDVNQTSHSPKDLDLSELSKAPQAAIAGVTGIPAIVLQFPIGLENGHYGAAYEQARQQGYENVIIPIQNHISEDLTWQVLPELEKTKGAKYGFDISKVRVLQEDRDALYKRESDALRAGGITVNQFLTSIGKDTVDGGDVYYVPAMSTPMTLEVLIEKASALQTNQPPPAIQEAAKMVDIDRAIEYLQSEIDSLVNANPR
jgi:hypothetical protein